jgi:hypothetical protein
MGKRALPFSITPGIRLETEEKHGIPVRAADQPQDYLLRGLPCLLRESLGWLAGHRFTYVTPVTSVSPRSAQVPPQLPE